MSPRLFTPDEPGSPEAAGQALAWVREYLCKTHPRLGRPGPVCPYAEGALRRGSLRLAVHRGTDHKSATPARLEICELLRGYREIFWQEPESIYRAYLVIFPDLPSNHVIDEAQRALKPEFVRAGLMIGEFHDGPPDKPGLWNRDWRPLRSPLPLLAIRRMVQSDLPFLAGDPHHVAAYEARFGAERTALAVDRMASQAART